MMWLLVQSGAAAAQVTLLHLSDQATRQSPGGRSVVFRPRLATGVALAVLLMLHLVLVFHSPVPAGWKATRVLLQFDETCVKFFISACDSVAVAAT
jgi:hypothetical protein